MHYNDINVADLLWRYTTEEIGLVLNNPERLNNMQNEAALTILILQQKLASVESTPRTSQIPTWIIFYIFAFVFYIAKP